MSNRLSEKAQREMEERFELQRRAVQLLDYVVSEWKTSPLSVQCFDLRLVKEAKEVMKRLNELRPEWDL